MKIAVGAVVDGASALTYKTGNWRTQRPVINLELCKDCGVCEMICPDSAVHVVNEHYEIDYDYCKGCGLCAHECATGAITMIVEVK